MTTFHIYKSNRSSTKVNADSWELEGDWMRFYVERHERHPDAIECQSADRKSDIYDLPNFTGCSWRNSDHEWPDVTNDYRSWSGRR